MSQTNCLPAWSVGTDCYQDVYNIVRRYGKSAVVIGGKTALEKAYDLMADALASTDFTMSAPLWYGGDATHENAAMLAAMDVAKDADMVFAVGGGRVVDCCKMVAQWLDKPLFTFPTIASNCAGITSVAVTYHPDGTFKEYFYPDRCPDHCFINTQVSAEAPEEFLWAGIGDALSKECEVEMASRGEPLCHTTLLGVTLAKTCTDPLLEYGEQAMEECRQKKPGYAFDQVTLAIVISTGLVSNFTCHPTDFYFNSSLAHAVYYGATMVPESGHKHLHGAIVSYGVLVLLAVDGQMELCKKIMTFDRAVKLPITLAEIGLAEKDLQVVADKAATVLEWTKVPYEVTKEAFMQAMRDVDAAGRAMLAAE